MNQTSIIGGINFSYSDTIIVALLIYLFFSGIKVPGYHTVYFLFLSAALVTTSIFYTPYKFGVTAEIQSILTDYIKLAVVFAYFIAGFNLIQEKAVRLSLKWYSIAALLAGTLGIVMHLFGLTFLYQWYDFGEFRYNGFMNDPNYFAIVQISALPFFLREEKISLKAKLLIFVIILGSIFLSGSKTGLITLGLYMVMFIFRRLFKRKLKYKTVLFTFVSICLLLIILGILPLFESNLSLNLDKNLQYQRMALLFTDFNAAFNDSGSSRLTVWLTGIQLIGLSPLLGVGVGTYTAVAEKISGIGTVAHNTYIQSYSEWGGIFATIFYVYLAALLFKATLNKEKKDTNRMLRDILIVLLIGSIAVSLNNARMFWFFLGVLICNLKGKQQS
ncbi:O-antigen ligase family protein [Neobacillus niacini]|uniref:O-antigen ligase family protein n=1 Tax=Neobacillus niacini TaxID=86668 RepID=UPI00126A23A8|nr:O-antigen ligase family protein [Neobacillus niacini]